MVGQPPERRIAAEGGRAPSLSADELTEEQAHLYREITGSTGRALRGPAALWIRNPQVGRAGQIFSSALRDSDALPMRLHELVILVVAREWAAKYPFYVHSQSALKEGLSEEIVEAIREERTPYLIEENDKAISGRI